MGLHVAQMGSIAGQRACYDAVTENNARILGLEGYGLQPGCRGDFVLLQARSCEEAVRLRAARLLVVRGGRVLARAPEQGVELDLPGRPRRVDFTLAPGARGEGGATAAGGSTPPA
jgi:cytosine deaminase